MTKTRKMPPLGAGSIDLDALHAADRRGEDLAQAIEKARVKVEEPAQAAPPPEPPAPPPADPAAKTAKSASA